ncbi:hypothetical protein ASE60_24785 [Ensifer sp. Root278]|nr:hypothetical protein ASE60_24785 [Ensifer sp. Root278]
MFSAPSWKALLPHEMDQIEQVFADILRERRLSRDCETAEDIARRLIICFQDGIREPSALRGALGSAQHSTSRVDLAGH